MRNRIISKDLRLIKNINKDIATKDRKYLEKRLLEIIDREKAIVWSSNIARTIRIIGFKTKTGKYSRKTAKIFLTRLLDLYFKQKEVLLSKTRNNRVRLFYFLLDDMFERLVKKKRLQR